MSLESNSHRKINDFFSKPLFIKRPYLKRSSSTITITLQKRRKSLVNLKEIELISIKDENTSIETPFAQRQKSLSTLYTTIKEASRNDKQDKLTSITSLRLSQSPTKFAFGRGLIQSETSNFKIFKSKSKSLSIDHKKKTLTLHKCTELSQKSIEFFKSKPIIQKEVSGLSRYHKLFPILSSKKKIPYVIQKGDDLDYKYNANLHLYHSYHPVDRNQKKKANAYINALNQNIQVEYGKDFNLLHNDRYSMENMSKTLISSKSSSVTQRHSGDGWIKKYFTLITDIDTHLEKENLQLATNLKKEKYNRFKIVLLKAAMHFVKWGIDIHDFYNEKYYKIPPFKDNELCRIICAIRENELRNVNRIIQNNKFVLLDCDLFGQTPLHWASKRNMFKIISCMIMNGAKIGAIDLINRTPLHIAAQMNNLEATIVLLFGMADPNAKTNIGLKPFDLATATIIQYILKKAEEYYGQLKDMNMNASQMRFEIYRVMKIIIEIELVMPFNFFEPYIY